MIYLDGYKVTQNLTLEDYTAPLSDSLSALREQTWIENPVSSVARMTELSQVSKSDFERSFRGGELLAGTGFKQSKEPPTPIVDQNTALKRTKEAGVKLDIPENGIPEGALDLLIKRKREEVKRKALIAAAPEGFWSGAAQIGTGLAVSLADPLNVASAFIPIVGEARIARMLGNTTSALGRAGVRAGVGVTEGAVGAALIEPLVLGAAAAEQADYDMYDSFMNIVFGAVLGGGLHPSAGAIGDALRKAPIQTKQDMLRAAVGQAADDRAIDVGYVAKSDPEFQQQWRENHVRSVIDGVSSDAKISAAIDAAIKNNNAELRQIASRLPDAEAAKAINDLDGGKIPEALKDDVIRIAAKESGAFDAPTPSATQPRAVGNQEASSQASARLSESSAEVDLPTVEQETNDILTAIQETGADDADIASVRAEIDAINKQVDSESKGLKTAVMCMLGV